ncbi:hypothetical protein [Pseudochelatococcus sp. G4_1912]|uniref:hypothetical protein n=1 Tax=Pseudochelatococcus sp. G4_1912 TaxID=3114288 RepID=UPI0039C6D101
MASGERHERLYPAHTAHERWERPSAGRGRARRKISLISFILSAALFAGLVAIAVLSPAPSDAPSNSPAVTAYVAQPTPAIDALGDKLMQKPNIWTLLAAPEQLFQLRSRELLELSATYTAREHGLGGREDVLTFGSFGGHDLHLHFAIYRMGKEAPRPSTFFVDLARRSAESGVGVVSTGRAIAQETKFGPAEIADATLSYNGDERQCKAFRLTVPASGQAYQMSGWACDETPVTPNEIACFVDHLALTAAADSAGLSALFTSANQHQRPECGGIPIPVPPEGE